MTKTVYDRQRRIKKREEEKKKRREERKRRKGKLRKFSACTLEERQARKKLRTCTITNGENHVKKREGRPHFNRYSPSRKSLKRKGHPLGARAKKRL